MHYGINIKKYIEVSVSVREGRDYIKYMGMEKLLEEIISEKIVMNYDCMVKLTNVLILVTPIGV